MRLRNLLIPAIVVVGLAGAVSLGSALSGPQQPLVDEPAPALHGIGLHGQTHDLADLKGNVVLVNVWASWCAPCEEEIPVLVEADRRFSGEGLHILGVVLRDAPESARRAAAEWGADAYPHILDEDGQASVAWGVRGVPETFIVDRDGNVVYRHVGPVSLDWLDERLAPVMER